MRSGEPVLIEVAVNGGRHRGEHPAVPLTPAEVAAAVERCAAAGATVFHIHERAAESGWSTAASWYAECHRRARAAVPEAILSITSIRPTGVSVATVVEPLTLLAADPATRTDLVSINLGHIVLWEPTAAGSSSSRRTVHFPNAYEDIVALLDGCRERGIVPELGVMDLGFVSNAVALRDDGLLPERPWFLVELDSPAFDAGPQVAPSSVATYDAIVAPLRHHFPDAAWAAQGREEPGYAVLRRALATGAHVRVGLEDSLRLPDGTPAEGNAALVDWAVAAARAHGRRPATAAETRELLGLASR